MQERYLGDSHDFLKYALLRHLAAELGWRIGVNWYLTDPVEVDSISNNDGQKRHHLKGGIWETSDPELFSKIKVFEQPCNRMLRVLEESNILPPDTQYYDDIVPVDKREQWFENSCAKLRSARLIFMDPDNGFEVPSMLRRKAPKYSRYEEAKHYLLRGHAVVAIQFARQCNPVTRGCSIRQTLLERCGESASLPIIRGRVAPNILFLTLAQGEEAQQLDHALRAFTEKCLKAEVID